MRVRLLEPTEVRLPGGRIASGTRPGGANREESALESTEPRRHDLALRGHPGPSTFQCSRATRRRDCKREHTRHRGVEAGGPRGPPGAVPPRGSRGGAGPLVLRKVTSSCARPCRLERFVVSEIVAAFLASTVINTLVVALLGRIGRERHAREHQAYLAEIELLEKLETLSVDGSELLKLAVSQSIRADLAKKLVPAPRGTYLMMMFSLPTTLYAVYVFNQDSTLRISSIVPFVVGVVLYLVGLGAEWRTHRWRAEIVSNGQSRENRTPKGYCIEKILNFLIPADDVKFIVDQATRQTAR